MGKTSVYRELELYERLPDKEPTSFELTIFKWIFLPIIAFGLFQIFSEVSDGRNKCENICLEKEFPGFRYTPSGRHGIGGNTCHCLTEEKAILKIAYPRALVYFKHQSELEGISTVSDLGKWSRSLVISIPTNDSVGLAWGVRLRSTHNG